MRLEEAILNLIHVTYSPFTKKTYVYDESVINDKYSCNTQLRVITPVNSTYYNGNPSPSSYFH